MQEGGTSGWGHTPYMRVETFSVSCKHFFAHNKKNEFSILGFVSRGRWEGGEIFKYTIRLLQLAENITSLSSFFYNEKIKFFILFFFQ